ncbi:STAS domain-containing protein [Methanobacterium petrolearium]|uniref:STAS domain-containing protein n=1 Tax=Methanobacterium petrolearium TaxID=710190 RepID=UPI001AE47D1C|nr:STAS domain-containing protein [Methanobacterium petrolearium]MBP1945860.1 anti-sigma B factor antagonist [Methanobacterium petrolearium]BDZ69589.1 anti-sigma factor antagonist [Methanobacterium petrolearium]
MNIDKISEEDKLIIRLEGRLDTSTAPVLEKELKKDIPQVKTLILDFGKLKYISSAGLRLILATQKTMNKQGSMIIRNVNDFVMEVFETTGFIDILTIE